MPDPNEPVLLDGATGTELIAQGLEPTPPHGSAVAPIDSPSTLAAIHAAYVGAGAQVLTTATLCAHATDPATTRTLATAATALARTVAPPTVAIAGSIGPHADPPPKARAAYRDLARALVGAGCDLLLVETMIDPDHAAAAIEAAAEVAEGRSIWLAIACGPDGRMLGGATIDDLFATLAPTRIDAVLVGCTELHGLAPALRALEPHRRDGLWLGAYPNTGHTHDGRHDPRAHAPASLVEPLVALARAHALDVVGGCCGTDPSFTASLREVLHPTPEHRARADARLRRALRR